MSDQNKQKQVLHIDYLKENVYPELHVALIQLIDYVVKTEEVRKHQERLKKIKIFDKLEQKRTDKARLKAELGSDYESSEDSMDWDELGIDKDEAERLIKGREINQNSLGDNLDADQMINIMDKQQDTISDIQNIQKDKEQGKIKSSLETLVQIQENDEQENENVNELNELIKMKEYLKSQREQVLFNPLVYLARLLRDGQEQKNHIT